MSSRNVYEVSEKEKSRTGGLKTKTLPVQPNMDALAGDVQTPSDKEGSGPHAEPATSASTLAPSIDAEVLQRNH